MNLKLTKLRYLIILRHFINCTNNKSIIIWIIIVLNFLFLYWIANNILLFLRYLFWFFIRYLFSLFFIFISILFFTYIWLIISNIIMRAWIIVIGSYLILNFFIFWWFIFTACYILFLLLNLIYFLFILLWLWLFIRFFLINFSLIWLIGIILVQLKTRPSLYNFYWDLRCVTIYLSCRLCLPAIFINGLILFLVFFNFFVFNILIIF